MVSATEKLDRDANPVAVLGLGRSGWAACRLLLAEGRRVAALDSNSNPQLEATAFELRALGAEVQLQCETLPQMDFEFIVISPGLPPQSPLRQAAESNGGKVLSELELGWSRIGAPTIAVTGSNGKSTAVKWIAESLRDAGQTAWLGGNYGVPACELALKPGRCDWLVLEASSFQLETVSRFRADVAVILNILPNHLDRHGDMQSYSDLKKRIFLNARSGDRCILPQELQSQTSFESDGAFWSSFACRRAADWVYSEGRVSWSADPSARWHRGRSCIRAANRDESAAVAGTYFGNDVLGATAAAVMAVCDAAGIDQKHAVAAARDFEPLPHRMQTVGQVEGVKFIDDSKATNLAAMTAAIGMSSRPMRLIAGGLGKGEDFESVADSLRTHAEKAYLIGSAAAEMEKCWNGAVECAVCRDLQSAVASAFRDAVAGETILLSPGCASFDQFTGFEQRGDKFIKYVNNLAGTGRL